MTRGLVFGSRREFDDNKDDEFRGGNDVAARQEGAASIAAIALRQEPLVQESPCYASGSSRSMVDDDPNKLPLAGIGVLFVTAEAEEIPGASAAQLPLLPVWTSGAVEGLFD